MPFAVRTRGNADPGRKPRVYFTCHPADFAHTFEKICGDIFQTHDCAVYYTENMSEEISAEDRDADHPKTCKALHRLARHYERAGALSMAADWYEILRDICRRTLGETHPDTRAAELRLAATRAKLKNI